MWSNILLKNIFKFVKMLKQHLLKLLLSFMLKQHGKMQIGGFWANRINSTFSLPLPYLCGRQVRNIFLRKIFWYFAETKIMSSMKIHYQQNLTNLLDYYINFRRSYPEDR